jgi:hypothetical protein
MWFFLKILLHGTGKLDGCFVVRLFSYVVVWSANWLACKAAGYQID